MAVNITEDFEGGAVGWSNNSTDATLQVVIDLLEDNQQSDTYKHISGETALYVPNGYDDGPDTIGRLTYYDPANYAWSTGVMFNDKDTFAATHVLCEHDGL